MAQLNALALFALRTYPSNSGFYTSTQVDDVEYRPFRAGGHDGLIWRSQGVWLMVEASAHIITGGLVIGERRRLLVAGAGFAPDPENGLMTPLGGLVAEYSDTDILPEGTAYIVTEAARRYAALVEAVGS